MSQAKLRMHLTSFLHRLNKPELIHKFSRGGGYKEATVIEDYKVETTDDDDRLIVYIWNPDNKPCMVMFLDKESNESVIEDILYNPKCTIKGNMSRGEGTKGMITFAIELLKSKGATTVSLSDNSSIICEDGVKVELGPMYFLKNGVTWYEKYFGFNPTEKHADDYEELKKNRIEHLDIPFLKSQPCSYFTRAVVKDLLKKIDGQYLYMIEWVKHL